MKFIFILLTTVVPLPAAADVPGVLTVAKNLLVLRGNAPRVHVQTVRQVENIIPSVAAQQALLAGKKASKLAIKKGNTLAKVKPPQSRPPPSSDRTFSENSIKKISVQDGF